MSQTKTKIFAIIDGNSIVHRAYHALPPLKSRDGFLANAVYGFFSFFLRVVKELKPKAIVAAFDLAGPTFRHLEFEGYKANRKKAPDDLYLQIPKIKDILGDFNVKVFEKQGFEADDIIGTIVNLVGDDFGFESVILSSDNDVLQLVNKNVKAMVLKKGISRSVIYGEKEVREKYQGLLPKQLIDFKALRGDPTDNIPGVFGVGEKTAINLVNNFGSVENLYSLIEQGETNGLIKDSLLEKLISQKEKAFLSRSLAEIRQDVEIDFEFKKCFWDHYDREKAAAAFTALGFPSLLARLP